MRRAMGERDVPPGELARPHPDDSNRTRMLKAVLKSVAKFSSSGLGRKDSLNAGAALLLGDNSGANLTPKNEAPPEVQPAFHFEGSLSENQERVLKSSATVDIDDECVEAVSGAGNGTSLGPSISLSRQSTTKSLASTSNSLAAEMRMLELENDQLHTPRIRQLLEVSGSNVDQLCGRLRRVTDSQQAMTRPRDIECGPPDGIRLVARPVDHDSQERSRTDFAANNWIADNLVFQELQDLSDFMDVSKTIPELRVQFKLGPETACHPGVPLLTDQALQDRGVWKRAIWSSTRNQENSSESDSGSRAAARTMLPSQVQRFQRSGGGLGSSGPSSRGSAGRRMQRDRSAPTLGRR